MKYSSDSKLAAKVSRAIGWIPEIQAIRVAKHGSVIHVRGTFLKPEEWRELARMSGRTVDGCTLRVHGVPLGV